MKHAESFILGSHDIANAFHSAWETLADKCNFDAEEKESSIRDILHPMLLVKILNAWGGVVLKQFKEKWMSLRKNKKCKQLLREMLKNQIGSRPSGASAQSSSSTTSAASSLTTSIGRKRKQSTSQPASQKVVIDPEMQREIDECCRIFAEDEDAHALQLQVSLDGGEYCSVGHDHIDDDLDNDFDNLLQIAFDHDAVHRDGDAPNVDDENEDTFEDDDEYDEYDEYDEWSGYDSDNGY
jgi:hypothetical protein